ncbi:hypothetical protein L1887_32402 [Cichorium endivia]|nr:hypothetical protein L1887_32402 [Cichorium endivia]
MDCNREEAIRAKQIAEKKMENKEFSAALKIAQKAQQLYPELENISQLILVCEVHCSAEKKTYGSEKDWYSILKIDPSSDDLSIKKQYRKLALVLHPDKNKFSGSTDAFKLIGEAQRVLLDREKRILHDSKRRAYSSWGPKPPNVHQHSWNPVFPQGHSGNFAGGRSGGFPFRGVGGGVRLTFWTVCPFCSVRYQFYRDDVLNKMIHCQSCKKSFTAYELNVNGPNPARPPPPVPKRNTIPVPVPTPVPVPKPKPVETQNVNRKRKKKVDESSESSDTSSSSESEEEEEEEDDGNSTESDENAPEKVEKKPENQDFEQPRRSARPKRNVSYKENVNDNDEGPAKPESDEFWKADVREPVNESQNQESEKEDIEDVELDVEPEPEMEPEVFECPDPEFSDFEKDRTKDSFAPGQIWAVYDTEDAMPRFYAFIRKVLSPGFNLQITWLKPVPETDDETNWVDEELPVSCGNFKRGKHDKAEDLPMFSHLVSWEEGKKGIFYIVPRKGETWALFKNWNINWSNDGTGKYEYEFVEVLSDYEEGFGFEVTYLEKLAGFRCLFGRKGDGELVIPESDKYRFSHMVPSCRMSGEEREGVPKGCYELDPAGLPASVFESGVL